MKIGVRDVLDLDDAAGVPYVQSNPMHSCELSRPVTTPERLSLAKPLTSTAAMAKFIPEQLPSAVLDATKPTKHRPEQKSKVRNSYVPNYQTPKQRKEDKFVRHAFAMTGEEVGGSDAMSDGNDDDEYIDPKTCNIRVHQKCSHPRPFQLDAIEQI